MHLLSLEGRSFYYEWLTEPGEANCREPAFLGCDILQGCLINICKLLINLFVAKYSEAQLMFQFCRAMLGNRTPRKWLKSGSLHFEWQQCPLTQ